MWILEKFLTSLFAQIDLRPKLGTREDKQHEESSIWKWVRAANLALNLLRLLEKLAD